MTTPDRADAERSSLLFNLLFEQAEQHAFILVDPHGNIGGWSRGAQTLFGYTREQALRLPFTTLFTEPDRERGIPELEMETARSDATAEDDRWHVRADGSAMWCTGSLTALRNDAGELLGYGKVVRDRTNLKEQLDGISNQLEAAHAESAGREAAITTLSHELRNLLAALTHGLKMLGTAGSDENRRQTVTGLMQGHIDLVGRLTNDMLDAQRLKTGKVSLQMAPTALQPVLAKVIDSLRPRLPEQRLQLDLLAPPVPVVVQADEARLLQVFVNLLDNAIKYTPADGRIWVKMTIEDPTAVVHVEDTGIGVPPHMLSKIFDLFTQVDTDASRNGLGIGLALVRDLVSMHGGSVQARSEGVGKGSEFTVRLPLLSPK
jgi:PAS domain S-box-containing protein